MQRLHHILFLLSLISFTATACTSHDELSQDKFSQILLSAFHNQEEEYPVINGTLEFHINPNTTLFLRNAQLSLQTSIDPFITSGLKTNETMHINRYMLYNSSNQMLLIAKNHMQTMDFQFLTDKEISKHLYNAIQSHEESLHVNYTGDFIYLSDDLLLLKFNNTSFEVGIHQSVLMNAGVDINYLPHAKMEGNYVMLPN